MWILKGFLRLLAALLAPVILVVVGAGVAGLGVSYEYEFVVWAGLICVGAGILWGIFLVMYATDGDL